MPETEKTNPNPSAPAAEPMQLEFPEAKIQGQGYSQFNPRTGWLWIGLKLPAFNFRTAWAFIKSQEYVLSSAYDNIEQQRMRTMAMANPKTAGPINRILETLKKH